MHLLIPDQNAIILIYRKHQTAYSRVFRGKTRSQTLYFLRPPSTLAIIDIHWSSTIFADLQRSLLSSTIFANLQWPWLIFNNICWPSTIFVDLLLILSNSHALQLLDVPSREFGVACRCYARVLRGHRVLVVVDRERLEAVVHNRGEVVPLTTGVHLDYLKSWDGVD